MKQSSRSLLRPLVVVGFLLSLPAIDSRAEPLTPPPPARYRVLLEYRLAPISKVRIEQFFELLRDLKAVGFQKDPGPENEVEDTSFTRMTGTIAPANARRLLSVHRVRRVLLYPEDFKTPADPNTPVKVSLEMPTGLLPPQQQVLANQVRPFLDREGFREAVGYDHRGQTRIVGTIPAGRLENLLTDLRERPLKEPLPEILRSLPWPIRLVVVMAEPEGVEPEKTFLPPPPPPPDKRYLLKISPDLRALPQLRGGGEKAASGPIRVEVIVAAAPTEEGQRAVLRLLRGAVPEARVEYQLGALAALLVRPERVADLAQLPEVTTVRLPQSAATPLLQGSERPDSNLRSLRAWQVDRLHQLGGRGKGVRAAVLAEDFRGYQRFIGKGLPAGTQRIDLTAERQPTLEPEPTPGDPQEVGAGTYQALALALVAPEVELVLVRVAPSAPYQIAEVLGYLDGRGLPSPALERRAGELQQDLEGLRLRREELLEERREILNNFNQDEAAVKRREAYLRAEADLKAQEAAVQQRQGRYYRLLEGLQSLKGVRVVSCGLTWGEGYPADGVGALSALLNDRPCRSSLWVQAAGDTRGQAWAGLFLDADGNGIMEFADPQRPLRPQRWTAELNFLAWQPHGGAQTLDIPAKANVRLSLQWREAHDPVLLRIGEDAYRAPLANLGLMVLRQRDPSGRKLPSDAMEVVNASNPVPYRLPQRLDNRPNSSVYEQVLEFTAEKAGRYAVRVDGRLHPSFLPAGAATLPAADRFWELRPRLFVEVTDGASRSRGRPVWLDYATAEGEIGMPADANGVLSVGAADPEGHTRPFSPRGPAWGLGLLAKPELLPPDGLALGDGERPATGTAVAAGFAAGVAACNLSLGAAPEAVRQAWQQGAAKGWDVLPHRSSGPR